MKKYSIIAPAAMKQVHNQVIPNAPVPTVPSELCVAPQSAQSESKGSERPARSCRRDDQVGRPWQNIELSNRLEQNQKGF